MVAIVQGGTVVEAWEAGARVLLDERTHRIRNMVTEIGNPTEFDACWLHKYDPKSVGADDRLSVVAKVLFPPCPPRANETRAEYYERWRKVLKRSRKSRKLRRGWGSTYFERLTSFNGSENQVERAIHALSTWPRMEAAIVAHLSSPSIDGLRTRGSPCLQFIELLWAEDHTIDLNKTLGNFIGLGRLLSFIGNQTGKLPGKVVCHSVRAYCDKPSKLRALLAR
jgi:hypothetical protein